MKNFKISILKKKVSKMNFENEARYLIVDHFDKIKNKIDINVESLLCNNS